MPGEVNEVDVLGRGGEFLLEYWFLWGGDEKFGGGEGFGEDEEFGYEVFSFGGVIGGGLYFFRNSSFHSLYSKLLSYPKLFASIDQVSFSRATWSQELKSPSSSTVGWFF